MKPANLGDIVGYLNALSAADFKTDKVDTFLKGRRLSIGDLTPFCHFREDTYGRNLVYRNDFFEMLVLTWLPRHRTPIHDHAGQRCWMMMVQGKLCFRNYAPTRSDNDELVPMGGMETHEAGETVYIDDGIGLHSIANASHEPAVSIHLYASPIARCRIFNETARRLEWLDLKYFTTPELGLEWGRTTLDF